MRSCLNSYSRTSSSPGSSSQRLGRGDVGRINDLRPQLPQQCHRRLGDRVTLLAVPPVDRARHADARAVQAARVEEPGVVPDAVARPSLPGPRGSVPTSVAEQRGRVGDGPAEWADRVLAVGDRDHSRPADQADRRLDADDRVDGRGADDRAVGLGPDRRTGAGSRRWPTAEPELEPQGVTSRTYGLQTSARRGRSSRCDERDERKLAHSLMFALPRRTAPASRRRRATNASCRRRDAHESERAGGGQHLVGGVDVVLQQDGDAVQWPARSASSAAHDRERRRCPSRRD